MNKILMLSLLVSASAFGMKKSQDGADVHGLQNIDHSGSTDQNRFVIGNKQHGDSLDDCKQLTYAFCQKMYQGTGRDAHALVDKQYTWLQGLWDKKDPELNIIYAQDELAQKRLASCLAYMVKNGKNLYVLRMIAVDPEYCDSGVFSELVSFIPTISGSNMQKALTCVPRIKVLQAFMNNAGFEETAFNPDGCPVDKWQGYEKVLSE